MPGGLGRPEDVRQPQLVAERELHQVLPVLAGERRPVAGAGGVAAVGGAPLRVAEELPDQPVVRQQHLGHPPGRGGFELGEPAQLRDRVAGGRHGPDGLRPGGGAAQGVHQRSRGAGRARVVPEDRGAHQHAARVQADHAVLLGADADGPDALQQAPRGGLAERVQPGLRVGLGGPGVDALRCRVRRLARTQDGAGLGVARDDPGAVGRTVYPRDDGHVEIMPQRAAGRGRAAQVLPTRYRWVAGPPAAARHPPPARPPSVPGEGAFTGGTSPSCRPPPAGG